MDGACTRSVQGQRAMIAAHALIHVNNDHVIARQLPCVYLLCPIVRADPASRRGMRWDVPPNLPGCLHLSLARTFHCPPLPAGELSNPRRFFSIPAY
ncbi:hypothetical protein J6590_017591 [Homalodisca vitripennis]|nr:hypothetical protein J6590_017591 [Homalodisca vitripennis]